MTAVKPKKLVVATSEACATSSTPEVKKTTKGKDVRLTAPHRRKLAHGNIKGVEELPPIENYVYVPEEDMWIRRGSVKMAAKMANGYTEMSGMNILIRKNIYMLPENPDIRPIPAEAHATAGHFFSIFDVVCLVLKQVTHRDPVMWARCRTVCKKFRNAVDEYATGPELFHIDLFEKYAKKPWKARIKMASERVQKLYVSTIGAGIVLDGHKGSKVVVEKWMKEPEVKAKLKRTVLQLLTDRSQRALYQAYGQKHIAEASLFRLLSSFSFTTEELAMPVWHRYEVTARTPPAPMFPKTIQGLMDYLEHQWGPLWPPVRKAAKK